MGPKLTKHKRQKLKNANNNKTLVVDIVSWKNDSKLTEEENQICIKYYQLHAKKLGMNISHYMQEFHCD